MIMNPHYYKMLRIIADGLILEGLYEKSHEETVVWS